MLYQNKHRQGQRTQRCPCSFMLIVTIEQGDSHSDGAERRGISTKLITFKISTIALESYPLLDAKHSPPR